MTTLHSLVLASTPAGYWPLSETSGSTAADDSGNGHAGTYVNVTLNQTGLDASQPSAGAVWFSGTDSKVVLPSLPSAASDEVSFMAMVNFFLLDAVHGLLFLDFENVSPQMRFRSIPDGGTGAFVAAEITDDTFGANYYDYGETVDLLQKHIFIVRFKSTGDFDMWVDGVQIATSSPGAHTFDTSSPTSTNIIGFDGTSSANTLMQHVAYWNRALTDTEIANFSSAAMTSAAAGMQVTEAADTAHFTMSDTTARMLAVEAADTAHFTLSEITARILAVEAADTAHLTFNELADRMQAVEANDTASFVEQEVFSFALHPTEAGDTAHGVMNVPIFNYLEEHVSAATTITPEQIAMLREQLQMHDSTSSVLSAFMSIVENPRFTDVLMVVRDAVLMEQLLLTDTPTMLLNKVEVILEGLSVAGVVSSQAQAIALLTTAIILNDSATAALDFSLFEQIVASDQFANRFVQTMALLEGIVTSDAISQNLTAVVLLNERLPAADTPLTTAHVSEALTELLDFDAVVFIDGLPYVGWVVNAETLAPSEYDNYPFESLARFGQRYYGASEQGFFLLDGDDDAGEPIQGSILTGETDFGSPQLKRCEWCHIGYTSSGELMMKVISSQKGRRIERWYRAKTTAAGNDREGRFKLGRGVESLYYQFEWVGVDGADFTFKDARFDIVELSRRV